MNVTPIKTEADYDNALARVAELMDAAPDSEEGAELDVLATLIDAYESKHFPIESPDPVEAIKFRMEHQPAPNADSVAEGATPSAASI